VTYPILRAMSRSYASLTILHIDAHPDLYDEFEGDHFSHACPFARIMEEGVARCLVQVGIRTMNAHQRSQADRFGVEVIDMRAWEAGKRPRLDGDARQRPGAHRDGSSGMAFIREVVRPGGPPFSLPLSLSRFSTDFQSFYRPS
jgi:arginase family enzyme